MDLRKILSRPKSIDIETCLPYGLLFVSTEGVIQWVNAQFVSDVNISKENLLGTTMETLFEYGFEAIKKSAETNTSEYVRFSANGDNFEIRAKQSEEGFTVDIRKCVEKVLTTPTKEEAEINRNKNNLIIKLSNDLKSPIQSIIGFSQALIDGLGGQLSEKQEKYTNIIYKSSNDLLYLTEKFVELSKSELGLIEKEIKVLDIASLVQNIAKYNEQLYKDKSLQIGFDADITARKTLKADENGIKIAIQNILDTVVRYMDLGNIDIVLSIPSTTILENTGVPNGVVISVICTGFSLSEAEIASIFDPYCIAEGNLKRYISRSMALTTVKNIIESMSGKIWITSEILKNTTFNILIPILSYHQDNMMLPYLQH